MTSLVLATGNKKKVSEMRLLLAHLDVTLLSKDDIVGFPEVVEDGKTFQENALKKARELCAYTGSIALADDSGLEVAILDGAPGIYSARFAGEGATDADNNALLLEKMSPFMGIEEREAQFRCVIAVVFPDGRELIADEHCKGRILSRAQGEGGFGYDPLFYYPPFHQSFSEISLEDKNRVSHRGKALQIIQQKLRALL